jgi:hypothetical protein
MISVLRFAGFDREVLAATPRGSVSQHRLTNEPPERAESFRVSREENIEAIPEVPAQI